MKTLATLLGAGQMFGGGALAPSINVLGAFFPDWLFCVSGGLLLTAIVRLAVRGFCADSASRLPSLALFALWVLSSLTAWVLIFQN